MSAALQFNEQTHTYRADGEIIPSVTQILALSGITDMSGIPLRNLEKARIRGSFVDWACTLLDEGDLDLESLDEKILGYVVGYQKFREDWQFKPHLIQHQCVGEWHGLKFGMTLDRVGLVTREEGTFRLLFDIKTPKVTSVSWQIQTAGYAEGLGGDGEDLPRAVVKLSPDGSYCVINHTLESDFDVWHAALQLAHWKLKNGFKVKSS